MMYIITRDIIIHRLLSFPIPIYMQNDQNSILKNINDILLNQLNISNEELQYINTILQINLQRSQQYLKKIQNLLNIHKQFLRISSESHTIKKIIEDQYLATAISDKNQLLSLFHQLCQLEHQKIELHISARNITIYPIDLINLKLNNQSYFLDFYKNGFFIFSNIQKLFQKLEIQSKQCPCLKNSIYFIFFNNQCQQNCNIKQFNQLIQKQLNSNKNNCDFKRFKQLLEFEEQQKANYQTLQTKSQLLTIPISNQLEEIDMKHAENILFQEKEKIILDEIKQINSKIDVSQIIQQEKMKKQLLMEQQQQLVSTVLQNAKQSVYFEYNIKSSLKISKRVVYFQNENINQAKFSTIEYDNYNQQLQQCQQSSDVKQIYQQVILIKVDKDKILDTTKPIVQEIIKQKSKRLCC